MTSIQSRITDIYLSSTFLEDSDPHKYAKRWASNMYSRINRKILVKFSTQINRLPYLFYFIKNFIASFYENGISPNDIKQKYLYRGITNKKLKYLDKNFISFTKDVDIAKKFATVNDKLGIVIKLKVNSLSNNYKLYSIDESLDSMYNESEILLLPGKLEIISQSKENNEILVTYKENSDLIKKYVMANNPILPEKDDDTTSSSSGGAIKNIKSNNKNNNKSNKSSLKIIDYDLRDKYVVFWRWVDGRKCEVIDYIKFPKRGEEKIKETFKKFLAIERSYLDMTDFIPEVDDLRNKLNDNCDDNRDDSENNCDDNDSYNTLIKMSSYDVIPALYDNKNKEVLTIHFNMPSGLFYDTFKKNPKEVVDTIITCFAKMSYLTD